MRNTGDSLKPLVQVINILLCAKIVLKSTLGSDKRRPIDSVMSDGQTKYSKEVTSCLKFIIDSVFIRKRKKRMNYKYSNYVTDDFYFYLGLVCCCVGSRIMAIQALHMKEFLNIFTRALR